MKEKTMVQKRDNLLRERLDTIVDYVQTVCYCKGFEFTPHIIAGLDNEHRKELVHDIQNSLRMFTKDAWAGFDVFSEAGMFSPEDEARWNYVLRTVCREGRKAINMRYYQNKNWYDL